MTSLEKVWPGSKPPARTACPSGANPGRESGTGVVGELSNLDALRAIAVLLVLSSHIGWQFGLHATAIGQYGVLIFFVHTSLVLLMSMRRNGLRGRNLFLNFYIRRLFRIYPLSIACVLAVIVFRVPPAPWATFEPLGASAIWSNIGLVMNLTGAPLALGPLWSLPYEIDMYAVLPLLFMLVVGWRYSRGALYLASVIVAASYWLILVPQLDFLMYLPCFVAGAVAFIGMETVRPRYPAWGWVGCVLLGATIFGALHLIGLRASVPDQPARWIVTGGLAFALPLFRQLPTMRWASQIAKYSYGIYLFHFIAMWCGFCLLKAYPLVVRIGVTASLLFAIPVVALATIEDPLIRLGKKVVESLGLLRNRDIESILATTTSEWSPSE